MANSLLYRFLFITVFFGLICISTPYFSVAQNTGGEKLETAKETEPQKGNNSKLKTSKRRKASGNPNQGNNRVIVINPFHWDWNKVMWFKARKSDYETRKYNPDKRPKRKTYDNKPNYKSADRKAITNPSELQTPLIPYDARIDDKGPILIKKSKPVNVNVTEGGPREFIKPIRLNDPSETLTQKKSEAVRVNISEGGPQDYIKPIMLNDPSATLSKKKREKERAAFDNSKLETATERELKPKMDDDQIMYRKKKEDYAKMDNDKFMTIKVDDSERKGFDDKKLMTASVPNKDRKPFDDDKLMTVKVQDKERDPFDNDKLMTVEVKDQKRKPFDNDKLMTASPANSDRKPFDDKKLMTAEITKPKKQDLHDDRLLTVPERKLPSAEMKNLSKEISKEDGDYVRYFYVSEESHPTTKILAAENTKIPFLSRTFRSIGSFFTNIWTDETQPNYVTRKKPKEKRDKNEGQIWDNSVHPDTWKKQEAESGEQ